MGVDLFLHGICPKANIKSLHEGMRKQYIYMLEKYEDLREQCVRNGW